MAAERALIFQRAPVAMTYLYLLHHVLCLFLNPIRIVGCYLVLPRDRSMFPLSIYCLHGKSERVASQFEKQSSYW